jgi:hypothetical protein
MTRLPPIVAGLAAILFAFWFAWGVSSAANLFGWLTRDSEGSGGIGAVSGGLIASASDLLIFVFALVANRSIAKWARHAGPFVRRMHVGHLTVLLAMPLLIVVSIGVLSTSLQPSGRAVMLVMLIIPGLFAGQTGLLAVLLALFAWDRGRPQGRTGVH